MTIIDTACVILHNKMSARGNINLARSIEEQLPGEVITLIKQCGAAAARHQQRLYLVGGVVRDILLERLNTDLDMVVEGDAIKLAGEIALNLQAKLTTHPRFRTATLKWAGRSVDIVMARAETYARPGALPGVRPGTIQDDLARRDFTINAMAVELNPQHYGELIDPFGGRLDLDKKVVRVLHEKSFTDDATRIWRAIRYEQRLDFNIEPMTLLLLERDLVMLKTVSGDRLRHELELVLQEEAPEKALCRAGELGVLEKLSPYLKADKWLTEMFKEIREAADADKTNPLLYMALLCYRLIPADAHKLIAYLRLPKAWAEVIKDTLAVKDRIKELSLPGQAPSVIYAILHGFSTIAYEANIIAADSAIVREHIELYLNVLKHVHPALTGDDIRKLGVPRGPKIKEVLQKLREARLDGMIDSKQEEEAWIKKRQSP